ncbi:hypothetical protein OPV22_020868 [Ensete ventricosum]|uniref:Uncharacterized protein n=1 Tax=Ensete ventricosum TaxID=4639 RepID=A0AAV8PAB4_ENSVE|nr:hypothetical protein OPV22_020868 [Ensete ventricosum]
MRSAVRVISSTFVATGRRGETGVGPIFTPPALFPLAIADSFLLLRENATLCSFPTPKPDRRGPPREFTSCSVAQVSGLVGAGILEFSTHEESRGLEVGKFAFRQ